jgi:Family of unknown function (DUF5996)
VTATLDDPWPPLPYDAWKDTYATLHMWTQIVGKVALALVAPLNHSWGIALHLTPRGLATRRLPHGNRAFTMEFDFIDHQLVIRASDGHRRLWIRPAGRLLVQRACTLPELRRPPDGRTRSAPR